MASIPIFLGAVGLLLAVFLIVLDRNKELNVQAVNWIARHLLGNSLQSYDVAKRAVATMKGFAFIASLFLVLATVIYLLA